MRSPSTVSGSTAWLNLVGGSLRLVSGHVELVERLLEHSANPDQTTTQSDGALILACRTASHPIITSLLGHGADPSIVDSEGSGPLLVLVAPACLQSYDFQVKSAQHTDRTPLTEQLNLNRVPTACLRIRTK